MIGDPWDTSYNPLYIKKDEDGVLLFEVKNEWTGFAQWMPDNSHNVSQNQESQDRKTLLDRRGGRFCTEGCGCINTGGSNISGAQTLLPQQLAITVTKEKGGRWDARNNIWKGDGYTLHLKYSNGAWRGRACCSKIPNGNYCDPCKTTTMHSSNHPFRHGGTVIYKDFLPSDCNHANNAYEIHSSEHQPDGDNGFFHGEFLHSNDQQELLLDTETGLWKRVKGYDEGGIVHYRIGEEDWKPNWNYREILGFDENLIAHDETEMEPVNKYSEPLVNSRTSSILPIARLDKACIADGFTPEKKSPWCRNPIYGTRVKIQDKSECIANGIESEDTQYCVDSEDNKKTALNKTDCLSLLDEGYHWKDNESLNYEWVDWEYEKTSCCGKSILDSNHPSRTPQMVGVDSPDSENSVCFTPHLEAILTAPSISVNNQKEREKELLDTEHYWTLVIRPCNFWKSCSEEGVSGTKNLEGSHDDYDWGTGCGEEIILNIPANQILNDSNFNLTLSDEKTPQALEGNIRPKISKRSTDREGFASPSRWREPQPMWNLAMGDLMGNPADMLFNSNWPGAIAGPFPGDAINADQWHWWCSTPDANENGIADGVIEFDLDGVEVTDPAIARLGVNVGQPELYQDRWGIDPITGNSSYLGSYCSQWIYYDKGEEKSLYVSGSEILTNRKFFGNMLNSKGADRFYGFNLQPQPFKAAEERQNRVKTLEAAAIDHRHWNLCASHTFSHEPGFSSTGGNWFLNYGPDYFLYYDFLQHDEISVTGSGGIANTGVFPTDYDEDCVEGDGTCSKKRKGTCDSNRSDYCDRHAPDYCDKSVPAACDTEVGEGCWRKGFASSDEYFPAHLVKNNADGNPHTQQTCNNEVGGAGYWQRRLVCPNKATCEGKVDREQSPAATCGGDWVEELVCLNKEDCLDENKCGAVGAKWLRGEECLTQADCEDKQKCGANGAKWILGGPCDNEDDCKDPNECNGKWTDPTACEDETTCIDPKECDGIWTPAKPCPRQGECERISIMARKYVDSHVGFLTKSTCGFSNWAGWYPVDSQFNDFSCPTCEHRTTEIECGRGGTCEYEDGTFEHVECKINCNNACEGKGKCYNDLDKEVEEATTEASCNEENYTWKPAKKWRGCCSWSEECDQQIGTMDPETGEGGWRDAIDKEECEKPIEDGGAFGQWYEACVSSLITTECIDPVEIPEDFADIVFGDQIGKCTLYEKDSFEVTTVIKEPITKTECSDESEKSKHQRAEYDGSVLPNATFEAHRVGVYYNYDGYPLRENSLIKQRPLIKEGIDASWENWNSMDYWAETGLFPKREIASYVNNTCVGTVGSGRISYASNEVPVQITSPEHKLRDGDLVDIKGVLGNFIANVMSSREQKAIQWEDTLYKPCVGENCDDIVWPDAVCPYESQCQDSSGNEIPNKTPLSCSIGECVDADDKEILKDDNTNCLSQKECLDAKGCGGTKWINPGTWVEFCDKSKYFACDGTVIQGEEPDAARFFVVKNTTIDTFDLYTCDKTPVDGRITNRINLAGDLDCETEALEMVCVSNYGIPPYEQVVDKAAYEVIDKDYGTVKLSTITKLDEEIHLDELTCANYGTCEIPFNAVGVPNSFMSKEDCTELGKIFSEVHPDLPYTDTKQKYTTACFDLNGNRDNSQDLLNNIFNFEDFSKVCKAKHSGCIIDGKVDPNLTQGMCSAYNGIWKEPTVSKDLYNDCVVDGTDFDSCWSPATWADKRTVTSVGQTGEYGHSVYKVCPFTGEWITYAQELVPEYMIHASPSSFNIEYRESFGGFSKRSESDANDYYVQIEQKGICPVCCDHFMPEKLTATLNPESSEILNLMGCGVDPCFEPKVCLDPLGNITAFDKYACQEPNVWIEDYNDAIIGDGFCCEDEFHGCNLGDLDTCKENPQLYGKCIKDDVLVAYTKEECTARQGLFSALSGYKECELFLRTRLNEAGTTNCRKCSKVYSEQNQLPTMWKVDPDTGHDQVNKNAPLDKNGKPCCSSHGDFNPCDCVVDSNEFPTCEEFIDRIGDCDSGRVGDISHSGALTGVCTEMEIPGLPDEKWYYWAFDPCSCFPSNVGMACEEEKPRATDLEGLESCRLQTGVEYYDNQDHTGCGPRGATATNIDASCYDLPQGMKPVNNTCPGLTSQADIDNEEGYCTVTGHSTQETCKEADGEWKLLGLLDLDLEYDGTVWRSEWTVMQRVGTKQCMRLAWPTNCHLQDGKGNNGSIIPINADCDGCDLPQSARRGVWTRDSKFRNISEPKDPLTSGNQQDGHFIRLIMGCGGAIPSIEDGYLKDGGFGPGPHSYKDNGIKLWAEITNCTFHDNNASEGLINNRLDTSVSGNVPCFPGLLGCPAKKDVIDLRWPTEAPSSLERKYNFAGTCMSSHMCGPKGPCHKTACCTYEGIDKPFHQGGPLWSGAVACSTGGDISHKCQTIGFDPTPQKQAETFTVYDIIDVNHLTGEGTLVVNAYPFSRNGRHCSYSSGTTISVGLADLQDAESDTLGSYSRNNKPKNPYLRGTVLSSPIKDGESVLSEFGASEGRKIDDRNEYMLIEVDDVTQFITKNPRKNRHLKYGDVEFGRDISDTRKESNKILPHPFGINPYPVGTQTRSGTTVESEMWPKGKVLSGNLESLRTIGDINAPGRSGVRWSIENSLEFGKKESLKIKGFKNHYGDLGHCVGNSTPKTKDACTGAGYVWLPEFLFTHVDTNNDFKDFKINEKLLISSTISYRATCKGSRMGYCDIADGSGKGLNVNECTEQNGKWVQVINDYPDGDKTLCEAFGGKWVIGIRNDDMVPGKANEENPEEPGAISNVYVDPENKNPKELENKEEDFEKGCPISCQLKGFYTENACDALSDDNPKGECRDCVVDIDGLIGCPLSPIDGSHIVSGDQELNLYHWDRLFDRMGTHGKIRDSRRIDHNLTTGFIISDETHVTINDEGIQDSSSKFENYLLSKGNEYGKILFGYSIFESMPEFDTEEDRQEGFLNVYEEYTDATKKCKESEECITEQVYTGCKNNLTEEITSGVKASLNVDETEECLKLENHTLVPNLVCIAKTEEDSFEVLSISEEECEARKGTIFYDVYFNTPSAGRTFDEELHGSPSSKNTFRNMESLSKWQPSIYHWGITKRKWKGVIHIREVEDLDMSSKDKETYTKYLDRDEGKEEGAIDVAFWNDPYSYWSRHGGAFDVIIGTPAPENNCRDHNSDKPVNLDFWLNFPQICCNSRGPLSYYECGNKCYPDHYDGPALEDLEHAIGIQGNSVIHCNIHETVVEEIEDRFTD